MYCGNAEPSIEQLMLDPLVRLRMQRAGVAPETVRTLLREIKQRLRGSDAPVWRERVELNPSS